MWIKNAMRQPNCPICRTQVKKNALVRDMLAFSLINELEILCTNKGTSYCSLTVVGCQWKGKLEEIQFHMPSCSFAEGKLPVWYQNYMKSKEREIEQEEREDDLLVTNFENYFIRMMDSSSS
jgi:hypothetical protein